jgi:hypothetical protein
MGQLRSPVCVWLGTSYVLHELFLRDPTIYSGLGACCRIYSFRESPSPLWLVKEVSMTALEAVEVDCFQRSQFACNIGSHAD